MLRITSLILATIINWLLFCFSVYLLFNSPYLISRLIPTEVVTEPLFSYYRNLGQAITAIALLLLVAALLNTVFLLRNMKVNASLRLADEVEKPKHQFNQEANEYEALRDEDTSEFDAQVKTHRPRKNALKNLSSR